MEISNKITLDDIRALISDPSIKVNLSKEVSENLERCRNYLDGADVEAVGTVRVVTCPPLPTATG